MNTSRSYNYFTFILLAETNNNLY